MKLFSAYYTQPDPFGIFDSVKTVHHYSQLEKDGCLILWGGEDISPGVYNQVPVHTHAPRSPSKRDLVEIHLAKSAIEQGIPIIGICRGAQLMCCLNGGTLFQHISGNHRHTHKIVTTEGEELFTSSCHHQALNLTNTASEVLAIDPIPVTVFTDKEQYEQVIPEVVHFPSTKVFAIQGHPEWMSQDSKFVQWCANKIKELLFK